VTSLMSLVPFRAARNCGTLRTVIAKDDPTLTINIQERMPKKKLSCKPVPAVLLLFIFCVTSATCAPAPRSTTKPAHAATTKALAARTTTKAAKGEPNFWDAMSAPPDPTAAPQPKWIWGAGEAKEGEDRYFRITFDGKIPTTFMTENPSAAWIWCAADDDMTVYLNNKQIARTRDRSRAVIADVRSILRPGQNVIAAKVHNDTGPGALALKLEIRGTYRETFTLVTDTNWKTWSGERAGWRGSRFDEKSEPDVASARIVGPYGMEPWGELATADPSKATPVEQITLPSGFRAELLYSVPKESQGSWVSMTPDPKGRLYVSDQNGPLFRVTPPSGEKKIEIERVELDIGSAQGMLWAFDSLYVVVNGGREPNNSGLYRLRDTDGDDKLDQLTTLKHFLNRNNDGPAGSEHGPHAVVLGPDKKLYVTAGNFTSLPQDLSSTSPAANWAEDQLLKRMTDGRGHDPTIYAPGGWIARTDADGKTWEAVATGFRNAYDMAFNADGELFTFDSDMEWDIGSPWWRPIRIDHVVSGAEFGWRNGSGKWRDYYADQVPPVLNVGMGSPTGVTFGYGAKFPEKYQRTFFASDWAYGKIFAVHLKPDGTGYKAEFEPFLVGKPFDVTDCIINPHDGAMYITIGGRGTQSGLYRVTYTGNESTSPIAPIEDKPSTEARALRHKLESFHGHRDAKAVDFAWPHLSSDDRLIRYAARVAIEAQDPATWKDRALSAKNPTELANAMVALCRVGNASLQPRVLGALKQLDLPKLSEEQLLEVLRAYQVCFIRMGRPQDPGAAPSVASRLDALYPNDNDDVNHELMQLLVYLESPTVIPKSLALLEKAKTQEEQIFYAFHLRNFSEGWTLPQRQTYFKWLNDAQARYTGGASFKIFLQNVRTEAIRTLGDEERTALAALLKPPMELAPADASSNQPPRSVVKNWQMADLTPKLDQLKSGRSFENGKAAFAAVSCAKCHRFNGEGGGSGPDISGVGNRFQPVDLLEAIVLPSKIISDQYQATEIITKKKDVHVGTIQEENDQQVVIRPSPLSTQTETVKKDQINIRRPSKVSIMPSGLIDVLREDEVLDLLAYLRSAGDPKDPAFRKADGETSPTTAASAK
jgi:putative heme-binding domain-containing protein